MKKIKFSIVLCIIVGFVSCTKEIDDVKNLNNPDRNQVLANGSDLIGVVGGGYVTWWQANNRDLYPPLAVAADAATCSWGNWGMRTLSNEPRNPILNSVSWSDSSVLTQPWGGNYAAISSANDVIGAIINNNVKWVESGVDKTPMVLASAYLLRGLSYGYLGLLFEKGFIVDENTDLSQKLPFAPYSQLKDQAIADLDRAINLAQNNSFEIPSTIINGVTISNTYLVNISNSYKARFIVQTSRNQTETDAINWSNIETLTSNGIISDFGPTGDDGTNWWSLSAVLMDSPNGFGPFGGRLDMRIVNLLDPNQPEFFPATAGSTLTNPEMTSPDARVGDGKDFEFRPTVLFRSERGRFHFSHYIHTRFNNDPTFGDGLDARQIKTFTLEDNRLLLAEAKARQDDLAGAIAEVNLSSRITRGNLPLLSNTATKTDILDAIFYERYIELFNTAVGGQFFDRRRTNQLQVGTFRHFPVPASELEVLIEPLFTFGGVTADPTGIVPHYNINASPARTNDDNIPTFN